MPQWGPTKAGALLARKGISPTLPIGRMTFRQRELIAAEVEAWRVQVEARRRV